jgi:hypothetical protein
MWSGRGEYVWKRKKLMAKEKENTWPLLLVRGPGGHFYPDPDPDDAPLP